MHDILQHPLLQDKHPLNETAFIDSLGMLFICDRNNLLRFHELNLSIIYDTIQEHLLPSANYFVVNILVLKPQLPLDDSDDESPENSIHQDNTLYGMYPFIGYTTIFPKQVTVHYLSLPTDMTGGELQIFNSYPDKQNNVIRHKPIVGSHFAFEGSLFHNIAQFNTKHTGVDALRISLVVENYILPSHIVAKLPTFAHRHSAGFDNRYKEFYENDAMDLCAKNKFYDNGICIYIDVMKGNFSNTLQKKLQHIMQKKNCKTEFISNEDCWKNEEGIFFKCLNVYVHKYFGILLHNYYYNLFNIKTDSGYNVQRYTSENELLKVLNPIIGNEQAHYTNCVLCIWTLNDLIFTVQNFTRTDEIKIVRHSFALFPVNWTQKLIPSKRHAESYNGMIIWTIVSF